MDPYEVLGVSRDADGAAIKRAYLAAAREAHPDFHVGAAESVRVRNAKRMQELNEAWSLLGDESSRRRVDRDMRTASDPGVARRAAREPGGTAPPPGKGWTPRAGDDGWMTDRQAWIDETDDLLPDEDRSLGRNVLTVLPVSLMGLAGLLVLLAAIFGSRPLLAAAAVAFIISVGLFIFLPIIEMARTQRD